MLVSRRHATRAVERNRIKRCIREAFRLEREGLGALDLGDSRTADRRSAVVD